MSRAKRAGWRVAIVAVLLLASPAGPIPSALASFMDDATVSGTFTAAALAPPTNLAAGPCVTGFTVSWTATTSTWRDGYEVQWKLDGSSTYTDSATTTNNWYTTASVSLLATYDVRVRAYKGANWKSTFAGPISVTCTS